MFNTSDTCVGLTKAFTESIILVADRHIGFHKRFFRRFTDLKLGGILIFSKVSVATMTHDHDDTPHAILTLLDVPAGKWVNL